MSCCWYSLGAQTENFMALAPQKFQEIVFQILFSAEFSPGSEEDTALMLMGELKVAKRSVLAAREKALQIYSKQEELDARIIKSAPGYQLHRISSAEKCALRLGMFELFHEAALSPKIVISEAIRLTRKFGTPESSQFVHAVLDHAYRGVSQSDQNLDLPELSLDIPVAPEEPGF